MSQFFNMRIGQSELDEQSSLIGGLIGVLRSGNVASISPTDKISIDALVGLENMLDAISDQMDEPEHPDQPDPFKMSRSELADWYHHDTGDTLDEVFGSPEWETFDGQEYVADCLN